MDGVAGGDVWPTELEHTFHHMRGSGADDGTDGQHSHSEGVAHTEGESCGYFPARRSAGAALDNA
jgi:hypothetical protein